MQIHKVPYHKLVFGKPLGAYYVDDKAITPDDFVSLEMNNLKVDYLVQMYIEVILFIKLVIIHHLLCSGIRYQKVVLLKHQRF